MYIKTKIQKKINFKNGLNPLNFLFNLLVWEEMKVGIKSIINLAWKVTPTWSNKWNKWA